MGLQIYRYDQIKFVSKSNPDFNSIDNCVYVHNLDSFKLHSGSLEEGWYSFKSRNIVFDLPYSTHNQFRQQLCELIGYPKPKGDYYSFWTALDKTKPFSLLFNFADNEGSWDRYTCRKLYNDFLENKKLIENLDVNKHPIFIEWYMSIMKHTSLVASLKDSVIVFE